MFYDKGAEEEVSCLSAASHLVLLLQSPVVGDAVRNDSPVNVGRVEHDLLGPLVQGLRKKNYFNFPHLLDKKLFKLPDRRERS